MYPIKKIYLAGPCDSEHRSIMVKVSKMLREQLPNIDIYCPWELKIENAWDYKQEDWAQMVFDKDVEAIEESDLMIMISLGRNSTAGTNWEQGYAFARDIPIIVFQITKEPTSLMTFCGCYSFRGIENDDHFYNDFAYVIYCIKENRINELNVYFCKTILT